MGRTPIEIDKDQLEEKLKELPTQSKVAEFFGCSQGTISNKIREFGLSPKITPQTPRKETHEMPSYAYEQLKTLLIGYQDESEETIGYDEVDIHIDTDRKIPFVPLSDFHVGSRYVYYNKLFEVIDDICDIPEAVTSLCGDFADNYNTWNYKEGQLDQKIPVYEQKAMVETLIKQLAPKALTILNGCHDEWSYLNDGFDFSKYLAKNLLGYYLGHGGIINLTVGEQLYRILTVHKPANNSSVNPGHGAARLIEKNVDVDIVVTAHIHQPYFEQRVIRGKLRTLVGCGSFKGQDRYASRSQFPPLMWSTPGILLSPDKYEVIGHIDYKQILRYL